MQYLSCLIVASLKIKVALTFSFLNAQGTLPLVSRLFSEPSGENYSISDYTLGLHGGKYQFSEAGLNFEGQQFAEAGYGHTEENNEDLSQDPLPKWALKLQQIPTTSCPLLHVSETGTDVSFQNEELSWERYYAFILGCGDHLPYEVEPFVGMLAPRSSGKITVRKLKRNVDEDYWLIIGTEATERRFQLD